MGRIMGYDHSLGWKDILKFVYCFMMLFLTIYIFKYILLLVPCSHKKSAICCHFKFDYLLLELESPYEFT
jgi:hypothetical protein